MTIFQIRQIETMLQNVAEHTYPMGYPLFETVEDIRDVAVRRLLEDFRKNPDCVGHAENLLEVCGIDDCEGCYCNPCMCLSDDCNCDPN